MNAANAQRDTALLAELFAQNGVGQEIADYLKGQGAVTIANFANYVDDKKELRKEVREHVPEWKDSNAMLAKLNRPGGRLRPKLSVRSRARRPASRMSTSMIRCQIRCSSK